jgi:hypothetical protein
MRSKTDKIIGTALILVSLAMIGLTMSNPILAAR